MARGLDPGELGEFGLIEAIRRRARTTRRAWRVAIGDDAAVLTPRAGHDLVWTTDTLVERVHFRWSWTDARSLGVKSLAVNLSDLGAMGARPLGCLLSLALPPRADPARVDGVVGGLLGLARRSSCPLVGGDTVASRDWSLTLSCVGEVAKGRALLRSGARERDLVWVSGSLGGSALGLELLRRGERSGPFVRRHLAPRPPIELGPALADRGRAHAAIDVSDGLVQDLAHLARASHLGADLHLERVPLARGLRASASARGLDPLRLALRGGEDYELLFASDRPEREVTGLARRLGHRVCAIGELRRGRGVRLLEHGRPVERDATALRGFDHFKRAREDSEA